MWKVVHRSSDSISTLCNLCCIPSLCRSVCDLNALTGVNMLYFTIPAEGESGMKLPFIQIVSAEGEVMEMSCISCKKCFM